MATVVGAPPLEALLQELGGHGAGRPRGCAPRGGWGDRPAGVGPETAAESTEGPAGHGGHLVSGSQ